MSNGPTLQELLNDFLAHGRMLRVSPCTLRSYSYNLRSFLKWLEKTWSVTTADKLRKKHLQAWMKHLHSRRTGKGLPLKAGTINVTNDKVRGFLRHLVARGCLHRSCLEMIEYLKMPRLLPGSVLTHAQVRRLLSHIDTSKPEGLRDRAMLELLYSTGVRAGELLEINLADVDLRAATARVNGKGNKQRLVPIGKTALRCLENYIRAVRPFLTQRSTSGDAAPQRDPAQSPLFLTSRGARMPYQRFVQAVHRHARNAGMEINVTPHTFRRSCATELIRGGANIYHVKDLLGHESLETLRHYTRLTIGDLKKTHRKCHPRERDERISG